MAKRSIYTLAILLTSILFSGSAEAQTIGYLGKKNMLVYQPELWPTFMGLGKPQDRDFENSSFLNLNHTLWFQRAVGRKHTLMAKFGYMGGKMKPISSFTSMNGYESYYYQGNRSYWNNYTWDENRDFSAIEISFGYRRYNVNAPFGRYHGFQLNYSMLSTEINYSDYIYNDGWNYQPLSSTDEVTTVTANVLRLTFEMGKTAIYMDNIVLDLGLNISLPIVGEGAWGGLFDYDETLSLEFEGVEAGDYQPAMESALRQTYMSSSYIMFKIGVGFIN